MGAGMYHIRVVGELDSTRIRAELDRISKSYRMMVGGGGVGGGATGKGKAGGGIVQLGKDVEQTKKKLQGLNGQVVRNEKTLKGFHTGFSNTGKEVEKSTGKLRAFGTETLHVSKKVIQFGAVTAVIRGVTSGMGDMVQKTFELDAALTEYKKVSDLTGKSLEKYTDQAFKAGRETAKTGTEMIEAATQFKKMGYTDQQSMTLATTATMFQNIADAEISAGDAALFINSQLKAFNFSADQSMHVIDSVNEVANNFAVGTNDLQLALSKTASAMGGFGNSFEQTIGIITAGTEIMVGQPSKVARGWRTIGANITKLAKQTDVYRDASGKVEIQMRKSDGTMKNTYEFLTDLHKQWGNLNKEQQTAIALEMGGKNQMEVFMATMNNFDTAIEATNTAMNAQGSAANENSKYLKSMQGHLQNLQSAWSEFANAMVKSSMLNKGMDILAEMLHFLSSDAGQAIIKIGLLTTGLNLLAKAALGLKGLSLVKLFQGFSGFGKGAKEATDALKIMQGAQVGGMASGFGKLAASLIGPTGLVAGIGLLSVGLAKYVDIGKEVKANKADKDFAKTSKEVDKLNEKLEKNRDEWSQLREKQRSGEELTEAEQARLRELEAQTRELKRQLEIKQAILSQEAKEKWGTTSPEQLKGAAKEKYIQARSKGQTEQQALAGVGVTAKSNRLDVAMVNYKAAAEEATKAENNYRQAMKETDKAKKEYGNNSEEYFEAAKKEAKAYDDQVKAQKDSTKYLDQLKKKRDQMYEDFGGKEMFDKNAPKTLQKSRDQLDKMIRAADNIDKLQKGTGDVTKAFRSLNKATKASGDNFLKMSKDGKKIESINVNKLQSSMSAVGVSAEDTLKYLKEFGEANPEATIKLNGEDVAIKDLKVVDNQIKKVDKAEGKPKIKADTQDANKKLDDTKKKVDNIGKQSKNVKVGAKAEKGGGLSQLTASIKKLKGKNVKVKADTSGKKSVDNLKTSINNLKGKTVNVYVVTHKKTVNEAHGVRHFAAGGQMANAEVNEQGFEIIQDADTGLMRVVNGGKRGTTFLGEGDSVFTHGQSVRMLRNAGLTEGDVIYGHGDEDFGLFGIKKLQGFKKGKKKKKSSKNTTKKNQEAYNKKYNAIKSAMESGLATLEYQKNYYNWTDSEFNAQYTKLYNAQNAALRNLNASKIAKAKGVTKYTTLGTDIVRAYNLALREEQSAKAKKNIESVISDTQGTDSDLQKMLSAINAADKAQTISADEAKEYRMQAYKKYVDYNLKQYENDKETYAKSLALIKDYYAKGQLSGEDYYKYLDDLAKTQLEKEKKRLQEQQDLTENTYNLAKAYVQRQIDLLETENEEQEKQNDLIELQNNLAKARNQRVRIYKEGEGFVYEKDTEAIREATNALKEYQSSATSSEEALNPVLVQWQEVLKLFDELEADYELKALENKVGATVGQLFGSFGTNTGAWSDWIKQNLSTTQGIGDVLTNLDKLVDTNDIINYLDSNGQVSQAIMDAAIENNVLPATYAAAITQMAQGMSAGINTAANLATQSSITAATSGAVVMGNATQYGNIYNFDNLVLPNVTNANEFIDGLNNLSTTALQTSAQRG